MIKRFVIFAALNFAALAVGGLFTSQGVPSNWYGELNKAPWTPPGWVFGTAWTSIMICFAVYMAFLTSKKSLLKTVLMLYIIQWILNVSWNPLFFYLHEVFWAWICITLLTMVIAYFFFEYWKNLKLKTLWLLPYLIWLLIANSLNAYIHFFN